MDNDKTISSNKEVTIPDLYYCKDCDSDPFTQSQRCLNFEKTLEQFHTDQGHIVIPYSKNKQSIVEMFTHAMNSFLPQNLEELKKSLRNSLEYDVDKEKTIDSDSNEFKRDIKGGFYAYEEKNSLQYFAKDFVSDIMLPAHVYDKKNHIISGKLLVA